jgi:hypothetical protein
VVVDGSDNGLLLDNERDDLNNTIEINDPEEEKEIFD